MSADVDLDTVDSDTLLLLLCGLHVIYVLITVSGLYMNSTSRPTSRLVDGVGIHAHGNLTGDSRVVTSRDLIEPRGSSEFTTVGAQRGAKLYRCRLVIRRPVSPVGIANRYQPRGDRYSSVPAGTRIGASGFTSPSAWQMRRSLRRTRQSTNKSTSPSKVRIRIFTPK